jgi:glucose-6-phosphate 1-dehydrogenase
MDYNKESFVFVIFGGTGNLTYTKLMPALYALYNDNLISKEFKVLAIGRRHKSIEQYQDEIKSNIKYDNNFSDFKNNIIYYQMDFSKFELYTEFKEKLFYELDLLKTRNIIYYLATAPNFFQVISSYLKKIEISELDSGFQRVVIEKPFGYDLSSANQYNNIISQAFGEDNIYRIDHYLGKEMIQNILTIRFTNKIFESVWNKDSIDNVQIVVTEKEGIGNRGGYYEKSGALRDMIQNHLLQILALIAMEPPKDFNNNIIRNNKVQVFKELKLKYNKSPKESIVFGQYKGYVNEDKVKSHSKTETFVALKCTIDNERFRGVPFFLKTGKKLTNKIAEIIIEFKKNECCLKNNEEVVPNLLIIKIQPEEGIYFRFNSKQPGVEQGIDSVHMDYCQSCRINYKSTESYTKLLNDVIKGDNTLFTRWDELENSWKFIDKIISLKETIPLYIYEQESHGPEEANNILTKESRMWWKDVL